MTGQESGKYLIVGAQFTDGSRGDLYVADGRFADPADAPGDAERVDADGLIALPGLVDLHTHLREPGREDAETIATGTLAAARGGFTAVFAMPNLTPATDTAEAAQYVAEIGRRDGHCSGSDRRRDQGDGQELAELGLMAKNAGVGCSPTTGRASPTRLSCGGRSHT